MMPTNVNNTNGTERFHRQQQLAEADQEQEQQQDYQQQQQQIDPMLIQKPKYNRRKSMPTIQIPQNDDVSKTQVSNDTGSPIQSPRSRLLSPKINIHWGELGPLVLLGSGAFSNVFESKYRDRQVAVKVLRSKHRNHVVTIRQAVLEQSLLARFNHPNILGYVGTGKKDQLPFLVVEKVESTLSAHINALQVQAQDNPNPLPDRAPGGMSILETLLYGKMIAEALVYLHYEAIDGYMVLHRDLKPDNVGIAADGSLKLLDFGLARAIVRGSSTDETYQMTGETGSLRYMAPEVARSKKYNEKADVYSLSLILYQLVSGIKPFRNMTRRDFYSRVVNRNQRPTVDKKWPVGFSRLLEASWHPDLTKRPNTAEFLECLNILIEDQRTIMSKRRPSIASKPTESFGLDTIRNALRAVKVSLVGRTSTLDTNAEQDSTIQRDGMPMNEKRMHRRNSV